MLNARYAISSLFSSLVYRLMGPPLDIMYKKVMGHCSFPTSALLSQSRALPARVYRPSDILPCLDSESILYRRLVDSMFTLCSIVYISRFTRL